MGVYSFVDYIFVKDLTSDQIILYSILKSAPDKLWTIAELQEITLWTSQKIVVNLSKMAKNGYAKRKRIIDDSDENNPKIFTGYGFYDEEEESVAEFCKTYKK